MRNSVRNINSMCARLRRLYLRWKRPLLSVTEIQKFRVVGMKILIVNQTFKDLFVSRSTHLSTSKCSISPLVPIGLILSILLWPSWLGYLHQVVHFSLTTGFFEPHALRKLIDGGHCEQAPIGHGPDTVVDLDTRRNWRLMLGKDVVITDGAFNAMLTNGGTNTDSILREI